MCWKQAAVGAGVLWAALAGDVQGGVLSREDLERHFPPPLEVAAQLDEVPAWPLFVREGPGGKRLLAYVFESIDLAPVPGYSGVPVNLLIALEPDGRFMDVRVLSHAEPVFLHGLGEAPLFEFVRQYRGRSLYRGIKVRSNLDRGGGAADSAVIDGISKATVSVRIVNESLVAAAAQVARARLGLSGADPGRAATVRDDVFEALDWAALRQRGLVGRLRLRNDDVERAFAGSIGQGLDREASSRPADGFIDLYVAHLNAPAVGRNLYGEARYAELMERFWDRQNVLLVMSSGRYDFMPEDYVPGGVPQRLSLSQNGLQLEIRDSGYDDVRPGMAGLPGLAQARLFEIPATASLDPATPWTLKLHVAREKSYGYPERVVRDFPLSYRLPDALLARSDTPAGPPWLLLWRERAFDVGVIAAALLILAVALGRQRWLAASAVRLRWFRRGYLAFTLGFIGWYAQGQLSILNLTGLVTAARGSGDLSFLLYDPVTLLIWSFVLATLLVWGRGSFCGWLCPFGALQELIGDLARPLRIRQWRLSETRARRLGWIKYGVLALILGAALVGSGTETAAEVEPFKTAITLGFRRPAPFVVYAVLLLALSLFVYKGYCRFLCPLGAGLALLGKARTSDWLPRRAECGSACQLCHRRCAYGAIERSGAIRYDDCFQCLDCVAIYHDADRCAPLLLAQRKNRRAGRPRIDDYPVVSVGTRRSGRA